MAERMSIHLEFRTSRLATRIMSKSGYSLIRFASNVRPDLVCRICTGVVREPMECDMCGLLICRACWTKAARLVSIVSREIIECPGCKTLTRGRSASRLLKQLVLGLTVFCKFRHFGCEAVYPLSEVKAHEKKCDFQQIACGNIGNCNVRSELKNMLLVEEFYGKQTYVCSLVCQHTLKLKRLLEEGKVDHVLKIFYASVDSTFRQPQAN